MSWHKFNSSKFALLSDILISQLLLKPFFVKVSIIVEILSGDSFLNLNIKKNLISLPLINQVISYYITYI